jgi:hypothetical protein
MHLSQQSLITEAMVDEPTSYFVEPMAESIKDFEPVEHVPTTGEVVPENATVVFPEPNLGQRMEPEAHHDNDDDSVPVASTERETQQITEPVIPMPIPSSVPVPNYDMPSYSMNMGSEVWGGDPSSSSVPIVFPSTEEDDVKHVESSPEPSIRFVDLFFFSNINVKVSYNQKNK